MTMMTDRRVQCTCGHTLSQHALGSRGQLGCTAPGCICPDYRAADREPLYVRHARHLGCDAALAAASWLEMSEADAASILDDVDPAVLDNYPPPDLSGQWADDPTPASIAHDVGANDGDIAFYGPDLLSEIADAWEEGVDAVWGDALRCHALRVVGRVAAAVDLERDVLEPTADRLRAAAEVESS